MAKAGGEDSPPYPASVRGSLGGAEKGDKMSEKQRSAEEQRQYEKWRATMERKTGKTISEIMRENGRIGGSLGHTGGFNARPELASEMGKRGAAKRWAKYRRDRAQDND